MSQLSGRAHRQVATRMRGALVERGRWLVAACLLLLVQGLAHAQLNERHSFNVRGDVEMIGNALLTCTSCDRSNTGLSNGTNVPMSFINVDGATLPADVPQNSSTATLTVPAGARILSAGLYWGGRAAPADADRARLQFKTPTGTYQTQTASAGDLHTFNDQGDAPSRPYTAYADVTAQVAAAGSGTYAAGGLTSEIGNNNGGGVGNYGGWALIVMYEHDSKPYRRLMVFDGSAGSVANNSRAVSVGGLLTPAAGPFSAYMGALVWEGDGGISGDQFQLSGTDVLDGGALQDALSPINNFWNSGITRLGERFTAKNPDYVNHFAVDLKLVDISNTPANVGQPRLDNSATGATLTFTSTGDIYFPHALVFVSDIFFPDVVTSLSKQARRAATGEVLGPASGVRHGEEIEYVVAFTNNGQDGATRVVVTDPIPANTSYVPGSLTIVSNATGALIGAMTDAGGDDLAEYDAGNNRVVFRIGTGADAATGGLLAPGEAASMSFRVRVDTAAPAGELIRNVVSMRHNAQTVPLPQDVEGEAEANLIGPVFSAAEDIGFCPVDGSFFNIVDGVGIYQYALAAASDSRVAGLDFPVSGNLNGLMVDPTGRTRLLFHQAAGGHVWAYDPTHPTNPGWYRTGATINASNLPRAGMTADGVGYLISAATRVGTGATAQMYRLERDGDYAYRVAGQSTLTYDIAPSDFGSGDIAFDSSGTGWLVAGSDLYRVDVAAGTATRQQNFTGAPVGVNYAGAAFGGDGRLYVVNNTNGTYYAMDLAQGTMVAVGTSTSGAGRDLASCSFPAITPAQLQVSKTLASIIRDGVTVPAGAPAAPGDLLTYNIEIRHVGGSQAATVFAGDVVETTPVNTTHSANVDDFTCTGGTCTNTEARNIRTGESTAFSFVVQVDTTLPSTVSQIANTVAVNSIDCATAGNDCDEVTPVDGESALSSSKALTEVNGTAPAGAVALGDVLTYAVVVANIGNVALPTVTITDTRITPDTITCAPLAAGANCTLVGTYTVTQADVNAGQILNTATITTGDPAICPAGDTSTVCQPTVTIDVRSDEIVAVDDSATTDQNTPVTIPVLDNDTLNGVPVDAEDITIVEVTPPANGSIVIQPDGTVIYTPNPGFSGEDSFEYQICEITNPSNCATATVTITVLPNVVEAIDDDAGTAEPGVPTPVVVVDNDSSTGAPLDPDSVTIVTPPAHGVVNCANGICTYTPAFGFSGEDSFVYRVCDTSYPTAICDTATVTIRVEGAAPLRITKSVSVREVKVGDLVRYTLTVENVGNAIVTSATVLDTPPQGFSYVDGSIASGDGRALTVSGHHPIRIASLDLAPGDTLSMSYLLRVGAGIRAGSHVNQAVAQSESGVPLSNIATAQVQTAFDPLLDDSLVFGTVFDDRNGDGWQASAALRGVRVQGGFAPEAYIAGSTTIDRGDGPQPLADASAPLLHGVALDTIPGRQSVADPVETHQVVIRQRLRNAAFTDDFALTSGDGATLYMAADGSTRLERSGDVAKGLSAAEPVVTRRVSQDGDGVLVEYVIGNAGIDERGIPGVRIASVEGLLIETDQYGRYHLVDVPGGNAMHGRNFILKVDPSTLPPGTEFTTANPLVRRVTPGLPVRFDFGVRLPVVELQGGSEVIELELGEVFFAPHSSALREAYLPAIETMAGQIERYRGGSVVVTGEGEHEALAFARAAAVRDALQARITPAAAEALRVELRTQVDDPHALVAGVDNSGVLLGTVLFDTDKSDIRPEFEALLDAVARRLEALGGGMVGIVGHTDVRGSHAYNVELGLRRAQSVFNALSGRLSPQVRAKTRVETSRDPAASVGEARK